MIKKCDAVSILHGGWVPHPKYDPNASGNVSKKRSAYPNNWSRDCDPQRLAKMEYYELGAQYMTILLEEEIASDVRIRSSVVTPAAANGNVIRWLVDSGAVGTLSADGTCPQNNLPTSVTQRR